MYIRFQKKKKFVRIILLIRAKIDDKVINVDQMCFSYEM